KAGEDEAAGLHRLTGAVLAGRGVHGIQECHLIDAGRHVRESIRDPAPALAMLFPFPRALEQRTGRRLRAAGDGEVDGLAGAANQLGFVVKRIALARPAEHEELDDVFGFGGMMQRPRCFTSANRIRLSQPCCRQCAEPTRLREEVAARRGKRRDARTESGVGVHDSLTFGTSGSTYLPATANTPADR